MISASPPGERSLLETILFSFGPTILLVALFVFLFRRAAGGAGGGGVLGQFGRSRARRVEPSSQTVTFADVAGIEEAKQELLEVVDFLRNPDKYRKLGARIPRGVLLAGAPGTGKTLLARAVAGEAGVPFFSASASEFIEAIVGIGASRVRDLFQQAKEAAPAIIFIDELDAIGRSRGGPGGGLGGHDEREQTLNQILTEMDGFDTDANVIVLGATNRPEVLDPALLRPGRFDRRVFVQAPDANGREAILRVHTRSVPLDDEVDLARLARSTPGMVGADLANLANEAALLAARRGHERVKREDFTDALEKIILGAERKVLMSRGRPPPDRLPRGRARGRRHAHAGRGPGAQGLDHPARAGARRDALDSRGRPLQLLGARAAREDPRVARRARGRGARLRRGHHRRGVGHPAGHAHRARDGRALGDEREGRLPHGRAAGRPEPAAAGRRARLRGHPGADRRRGAPHRRRGAGRHRAAAGRQPRAARLAGRGAARARDARRGGRLRGRRHRAARHRAAT